MFSLRSLPMGVCLASAIALSSMAHAAEKYYPSELAQMTPSVCWAACSTPCEEALKKCETDAKLDADRLGGCRAVAEACRNSCRDECGLKR
jgi:hypothetical protein